MEQRTVRIEPPDSDHMNEWMEILASKYDGLIETSVIGTSLLGRNIYAFHIGSKRRKVLYCGGVHGREWITTLMLMYFAEDLLYAYHNGERICEMDIGRLFKSGGLTIIPALNPDGIEISLHGIEMQGLCDYLDVDVINKMKSRNQYSRWKANARGVDLNRNFDSGWDEMRCIAMERGITGPSPEGWTGQYPVSEPETRAVTACCEKEKFRHLIAFHSAGEEIYWSYRNFTPVRAHIMAKMLAMSSGYSLSEPDRTASAAGLKDWFMERYLAPAFTVEIGSGSSPLPLNCFPFLYNRLREMLVLGIAI